MMYQPLNPNRPHHQPLNSTSHQTPSATRPRPPPDPIGSHRPLDPIRDQATAMFPAEAEIAALLASAPSQ